jgi:hypothetical protein
MALLAGSPAIGAGSTANAPPADQRGFARVVNGTIDIGAYQVQTRAASTVGAFDPSTATWYLRNSTSDGAPDIAPFPYGGASWQAVVGDWNGDGVSTVGVVDPNGVWCLRNSNSPGVPDVAAPFGYGLPGWVSVVGDWNGSGHAGIGMFDPSTATWYLRNEDSPGPPDAGVFPYGGPGWLPVVGDWTGSGRTTIGVIDPSTMTWYLRNSNSAGAPDAVFPYGGVGWKPVVGDWNSDGITTVGVVDPQGTWYLRNSNGSGGPDVPAFAYGLGSWTPLSGHFAAAGQALRAAGGPGPGAGALASGQLQGVVTAALARLQTAGVDPALVGRLASARYVAAPLPGGVLGLAQPWADRVLISPDTAGYGWFADAAPSSDAAFAAAGPGPAAGRMDLLTTVLHEMGHLVGRGDLDASAHGQDLMADFLPAGVRRTQALDAVFAGALPV